MNRIVILSLILVFSISFGQTKKNQRNEKKAVTKDKINTSKEITIEETTPTLKGDPDAVYYRNEIDSAQAVPYIGENDSTIYNSAGIEVKPEFPGGNEKLFSFISKNFHYSEEMKQNELNGRVFASFIIEKDGSVTDLKIIRGLGFGTEDEVLRVFKLMPRWISGEQNGKKVRCFYQIPIQINGKQ